LRPSAAVNRSVPERDLASHLLWETSLSRSLHRRELAEITRRNAPRRKGASIALSAAVAAGPALPGLAAAEANSHSGARSVGPGQTTSPEGARQAMPVLAAFGSSGWAVAAVQRALHIPADGLFGPQTRGAVRAFQQRDGLPTSGRVDLQTWVALFHSKVQIGAPKASAVTPARTIHADVNRSLPDAAGAKSNSAVSAEHPSADRASTPAAHAKPAAKEAKATKTARPARSHAKASRTPDAPRHASSAPKAPAQTGTPVSFGAPSGSGGDLVAAMIAAANAINSHHYAYSWGGGHNSSFSGPYDCSGAVSAVLHAAGLLNAPLVSGDFMNWGAPGAGAVTIYANTGHVYMSINGRFFGTSYANAGGGAGWFNGAPRAGFVVVHVPLNRLGAHARASSVRAQSASVRSYRSRRTYRHNYYAASRTYSDSSASSAGTGASGGSSYPSRNYSAPAQEQSTPSYSSSSATGERSTPAYSSSAQTTRERSSTPTYTRSSAPTTREQSTRTYSPSSSPAPSSGRQATRPAASSPSTHEQQSGTATLPSPSTGGQSTAPPSRGTATESGGSASAAKSSLAPTSAPAPTGAGAGASQSAPSSSAAAPSAHVAAPPVASTAPTGSSAPAPAAAPSTSTSTSTSPAGESGTGTGATASGASSAAATPSSASGPGASTGSTGQAPSAAGTSGQG